ncbi:hypothetical protein HHL10_28455 [Azohydromonas sp. G-1-1-14]|uniref:Phosphoribosyl-AMP cyclohydrolase n=2 Tax=Azohydromonas caseinilytica TaxID=2728836 RepID=A0A848FKP9_9BURK|nr:hypothetical protein [Azohydromonas caseinilytica]
MAAVFNPASSLTMRPSIKLAALALSLASGLALAHDVTISEAEVLAAQKAWGDALVKIARDYEEGGLNRAKATATAVIDSAYAYQVGPVLFKPTMASGDQTFRTTRQGAVSYFVGGDPAYPGDHGFALKGWRAVEVRNAGILLNGDTATTMGHVTMTDKSGKRTTVDKTWTFKKDDKGQVRIVVHHSSLPFADAH